MGYHGDRFMGTDSSRRKAEAKEIIHDGGMTTVFYEPMFDLAYSLFMSRLTLICQVLLINTLDCRESSQIFQGSVEIWRPFKELGDIH